MLLSLFVAQKKIRCLKTRSLKNHPPLFETAPINTLLFIVCITKFDNYTSNHQQKEEVSSSKHSLQSVCAAKKNHCPIRKHNRF